VVLAVEAAEPQLLATVVLVLLDKVFAVATEPLHLALLAQVVVVLALLVQTMLQPILVALVALELPQLQTGVH
jgi:hypothetical protein